MADDMMACAAEQAPAWCEEHSYSHVCDDDPHHDGTHECGCGHRWADPR